MAVIDLFCERAVQSFVVVVCLLWIGFDDVCIICVLH